MNKVRASLKEAGILTAVHYPIPLNRQPVLSCPARFENSEHAAERVMSLPMHPYLTPALQSQVVAKICEAIS